MQVDDGTFAQELDDILSNKPKPVFRCRVCGAPTQDRYFGYPLCCPYDKNGQIVKRCKWIVGEQLERGRPPKFPPTGDAVPF